MKEHIILNIPHSSKYMTRRQRGLIKLSDGELEKEFKIMTDEGTDKLYTGYNALIYGHSRLICDVERFTDDSMEVMSKLGMGVVYTHTSGGRILRDYDEDEKAKVINECYNPYHARLTDLTTHNLRTYGKCFIVDCHSYGDNVPFISGGDIDVCIGTDDFHTPSGLVENIADCLKQLGLKMAVNEPFAGCIIPMCCYKKDDRVCGMMIEINKRLYMNADYEIVKDKFDKTKEITDAILRICENY